MTQFEMTTSTELSGSGMFSISPFRNSTFCNAGFALVLAGEGQHFVGHVETVGFARRPHAPGGKQHIDAAAGPQIEHGFAGFELRQRRGIAAAERSQHGLFRNLRWFDSSRRDSM